MAGEITASTPVICKTSAEIKTALDNLVLATVTDNVHITPAGEGQWFVFKTVRAA